jgi:hypothetical protein
VKENITHRMHNKIETLHSEQEKSLRHACRGLPFGAIATAFILCNTSCGLPRVAAARFAVACRFSP